MDKILLQIAAELKVRPAQVNAAVELLDGGATVPFIARYRKEATDGLDDTHELQQRIRRAVGKWINSTHRRRPMIIPVVVEA